MSVKSEWIMDADRNVFVVYTLDNTNECTNLFNGRCIRDDLFHANMHGDELFLSKNHCGNCKWFKAMTEEDIEKYKRGIVVRCGEGLNIEKIFVRGEAE